MRAFPIPGLTFLLPFTEREGENATRQRVRTWLMRFLRAKSKFKSESCLKIFYDIDRVHTYMQSKLQIEIVASFM